MPIDETEAPTTYFQQDTRSNNDEPRHRQLPILSSFEGKAWCHKHAAHMAVSRRFPLEAARLLGTITWNVQETVLQESSKTASSTQKKLLTQRHVGPFAHVTSSRCGKRAPPNACTKAFKRITRKQAQDEAYGEQSRECFDSTLVETRTEEIYQFWSTIVQPAKPKLEGWNPTHGGVECPTDPYYVPLPALQMWVRRGFDQGAVQDCSKVQTKELYNGLCSVPIDVMSILQALADLSDPEELYRIPLIIPYPVVDLLSEEPVSGTKMTKRRWKVTIGVYMHRLLPEVLTCQTLHVILSALDHGSYRVTEPLHLPPTLKKEDKVFQSSPYPKVDWPLQSSIRNTYLSTEAEEEKKEVEVIDSTATEGSTREESVISPFTVRGLLKVLENEGCDVSSVRIV